MSTILYEAEAMTRVGNIYRVESQTGASGGSLIRLSKTALEGIATFTFTGASGFYQVEVGYFDENDGQAQFSISLGNSQNFSWVGNANTNQFLTYTIPSASLSTNASLEIKGIREGGELARFDYVKFIPIAPPNPDTTVPTASLNADSFNTNSGSTTSYEFTVTYTDNIAVSGASLDNSDVRVTGPNDFNQLATWVSTNVSGDGTPLNATYRIDAPGGSWNLDEAGVYDVALEVGEVVDTSGNAANSGSLGTFAVTVATDEIAPTAALSANDFNTNSGSTTSYEFTVTYTDNIAVSGASLDNSDVRVTGPNDFNQLATWVSTNVSGDGTPLNATYRIDAPGGSWNLDEAGVYDVALEVGEVVDTSGNAANSGSLGTFAVTVEPDAPPPSDNTVSYAEASKGVHVNLDMNIGFIPEKDQDTPLRIMPLGDSITQGVTNGAITEQDQGYRIGLWNKLKALGLNVDFVGSQSTGTNALPDKNHEGHPGWTITNISNGVKSEPGSGVKNWIPLYDPDVVLMMIGTNNMGGDPYNAANNLLNNLIDKIIYDYPAFDGGKLLVASIPPIRPDSYLYDRMPKIEIYNSLIPDVVNSKPASENVSFVDTWAGPTGLTEADMSLRPDSGLHPTAVATVPGNLSGYDKLAQTWFDALLSQTGEKDELSSDVVNVQGSTFDDVLVGDATANTLIGGAGDDELTGGAGADSFVYQVPSHGVDILTDFNSAEGDLIKISASAFGNGLEAGTLLSDGTDASTGVFISDASPTPVGNSANFLYNTITGLLKFDPDGAGTQQSVSLLTLSGAPQLSANQISIIA